MDISEGEKNNIRQAIREAKRHSRRSSFSGFAHKVLPSAEQVRTSQKQKNTTLKRGTLPSFGYSQKSQAGAVRAQFGKLTNDRRPASSNILRGGSEFFTDDSEGPPRYLR